MKPIESKLDLIKKDWIMKGNGSRIIKLTNGSPCLQEVSKVAETKQIKINHLVNLHWTDDQLD